MKCPIFVALICDLFNDWGQALGVHGPDGSLADDLRSVLWIKNTRRLRREGQSVDLGPVSESTWMLAAEVVQSNFKECLMIMNGPGIGFYTFHSFTFFITAEQTPPWGLQLDSMVYG